MTYKNTKFEDSPVFRSLERLAVAKGLIKNDEIKKEAAAKPAPSLAPTKDLTQNILRLCSGLRAQGFMSYANDLESKFLTLKHAETIMDQAHPEGSVTLPDMEGDCTVEDQEDAHKMIEDVVKKTPKGKFGNDILNLCKIVLAQDAVENESDPLNIIAKAQVEGKEYWDQVHKAVDKETSGWALQWSQSFAWNSISNRIKKRFAYKTTDMTAEAIEKQNADIKEAMAFVNDMGKESLEAGLNGLFGRLLTLYGPMRRARNQYDANLSNQRAGKAPLQSKVTPTSGAKGLEAAPLLTKFDNAIAACTNKIEKLTVLKPKNWQELVTWINSDALPTLKFDRAEFDGLSPRSKADPEIIKSYTDKFDEVNKHLIASGII